jgi:hypothetical protein
VGLDDPKVGQQQRDRLTTHRAPAIGMQRQLPRHDALLRSRLGDEYRPLKPQARKRKGLSEEEGAEGKGRQDAGSRV